MDGREKQKQAAAAAAAAYIGDGMTVGLGTGSTAYYLIVKAGGMIKAGRRFGAVATSEATERLARSCGIPVFPPEETARIDLAIDGVDEIDENFCAVKGGGGALLREKIVAWNAGQVIWIMDESKPVKQLGAFPLPVEAAPFGYGWIVNAIGRLGGRAVLREKNGEVFHTDSGGIVLDVTFLPGTDYKTAAEEIRRIPGVVETGLFDRICDRMIVGTEDGVRELVNREVIRPPSRCLPK